MSTEILVLQQKEVWNVSTTGVFFCERFCVEYFQMALSQHQHIYTIYIYMVAIHDSFGG